MSEEETSDPGEAAPRPVEKSAGGVHGRERQTSSPKISREPVSKNINETFEGALSFGDRLADRVASFGGSWGFIIAFGVLLAAWVIGNSVVIASHDAFDPYPFIFLNLMLSMVAALQAPVIMMSQNRQAAKDRLDAAHDYEVNLKAEIEIMALHDKLDQMRTQQLEALMLKQQEQIDLLTKVLEKT